MIPVLVRTIRKSRPKIHRYCDDIQSQEKLTWSSLRTIDKFHALTKRRHRTAGIYSEKRRLQKTVCPNSKTPQFRLLTSFAISNAIHYMKGCHHQNLKETSDGDRIHNSTKKTRNPTKSSPEASEVAYDPSPQHTAQRRPSSSMWFYAPPRARIWKYWEGRPIQPLLSMSSGCI